MSIIYFILKKPLLYVCNAHRCLKLNPSSTLMLVVRAKCTLYIRAQGDDVSWH